MANEITLSGSLQFAKGQISAKSLAVNNKPASVSGANFVQLSQSIPTTAGGTAIDIGHLSALGWAIIKNNDSTNFVKILSAVSGNVLMRINAGEFALFRFDASVTAPAAIADTAGVQIEYLIIDN